MVIIKINGGIGNQLFQYAFGRALEEKCNYKVYYDISEFESYKLRNYDLHHFNVDIKFVYKKDIEKLNNISNKIKFKIFRLLNIHKLKLRKLSYYQEFIDNFNVDVFKISNSIYLNGYWQSEKYFFEIRDIIKRELFIKTPPSETNEFILKNILSVNSVSVHIRRGDYLTNNKTKHLYGCCTLDYYYQAFSIISNNVKNPIFFVFSDDIEWAKENLKNKYNFYFVDVNNSINAYEDLRLMSFCKHNIIANSSFSWWGAWLNLNSNKIVISPKKWFAGKKVKIEDRIPSNWLKI
jgi:hypothetical protein